MRNEHYEPSPIDIEQADFMMSPAESTLSIMRTKVERSKEVLKAVEFLELTTTHENSASGMPTRVQRLEGQINERKLTRWRTLTNEPREDTIVRAQDASRGQSGENRVSRAKS
jgi:hypothetical protein